MTEINLGEVKAIGAAVVIASAIRITGADSNVVSGTAVGAFVILIQPAASALTSDAKVTVDSRLIKYAKVGLSGVSTTKTGAHKYKTISGALLAQATVEAYHGERDVKSEMHDYLPRYYDEFAEVETLVKAGANESTRMRAKLTEILDQFYVESATYGLERWRGLADIGDLAARSDGSQRDYINANLRGVGTVTPALLKSVVDSFYETEIYDETSDYKVRMKLVGKRGEPKNIEDIKQAVDRVIPAHLAHYFEFTYLPWSEVTAARLTWGQAEEYTAKALEEAFLLPEGAIK